ncbi:MAG: siderophore-interacting protein [Myxococcaceae bacterium]|nr:siderophore-interacting protein [Myxococcaceae bacterium]
MLGDLLNNLLFKQATVTALRELSPHFRQLSLEAGWLKGLVYSRGDKLQVQVEPPFTLRTFTPLELDATRGTMQLLVFAHGDTPAGRWVRALKPGAGINVFGPRRSLELEPQGGDALLFGDETSFAVAADWQRVRAPTRPLRCVFEVTDAAESKAVLSGLGLGHAQVVEKRPGHLVDIEAYVRSVLGDQPGSHLVLTGQGASIQTLRKALRAPAAPHADQRVKAYWARGKRGLD